MEKTITLPISREIKAKHLFYQIMVDHPNSCRFNIKDDTLTIIRKSTGLTEVTVNVKDENAFLTVTSNETSILEFERWIKYIGILAS